MALWACVLFSTIGIAASDFFCVNLSTTANFLGMSESLAGVTLLAFGNGSPDMFSTYSAMKINAGSLAVGELIGAATFITCVVAASMALVRPFKVGRRTFIRDVCFFAVAVSFSMVFLADGKIRMWEFVMMIAFYACYVIYVISWHFWSNRRKNRRRKERRARSHHVTPEEETLLLDDEDDEDAGVGRNEDDELNRGHDFDALERAQMDDDDDDVEGVEQRKYEQFSHGLRARPGMERRLTGKAPHGIRPSLVGALEFRAVLHSLESSNNYGRVIHMRRYSDEPMVPTQSYSVPSTPSNGMVAEYQEGGGSLGHHHVYTPRNLLQPSQAGPSGRVRAVSLNDTHRGDLDSRYLMPLHSNVSSSDVSEHEDNVPTHLPIVRTEPALRAEAMSNLLVPVDTTASRPRVPRLLLNDDATQVMDETVLVSRSPSPSPHISPRGSLHGTPRITPPPSIRVSRASIDSTNTIPSSSSAEPWKTYRYWPYNLLPPPQELFNVLFPTLRNFRDKTVIERTVAIASVPSVFLLTITLPVVDCSTKSSTPGITPIDETPQILLAPESPSSMGSVPTPSSIAESTTSVKPLNLPPAAIPSSPSSTWTRWLVAIQCILAPLFIAATFNTENPTLKPFLYALLIGLISLLILLLITTSTSPPRFHVLLCLAGFIVAIFWISTVAEEVVGILKAFGVIVNISDAILGLTIFAVGNSLGDLVANITVARLGFPVMALSACFGGPMLNILLGVGGSGLLLRWNQQGKPYKIEVSSTLLISAVTLLLTLCVLLVWVPLNRWMMDRKVGAVLMAIWAVSTIVNVVVEVTGVGKKWG
ncbi:hypothetical protein EX30DRAFT_356051 [Ascodesmis nigricans]|uniref:Sodium/calcium exchanger membrane region domain-containing protein n=1 Tax=Ascodesmis nigricans TaxID=341454 RepID=A0A4S2MMT8_9PEZI|nr:hypothetical protein EX30DRAFT_356051 [Ascodesmis nigricans]